MKKVYLEDYRIGEKMVSPKRTITETDIYNWAGLTGDWHPMYTDATYTNGPAGNGRVAHEMMTLTVGSSLFFRLGPGISFPERTILFYGFDAIRFLKPARIGDTIYSESEVTGLEFKDETRGNLSSANRIINQNNETLVTYATRLLVERRPAGDVVNQ